ncbi:hypothetical protein BD309DRAFT_920132 [Dichomitus squalens]|uniref:G-protein coupled receptors family 1 profile domain-containing protein n=2 Tax=Dichomitus squalens TaxID=114155 RepID=A0A4Q9MCL0_9APHY|nr:uncharacterized protein DICSQDRAFT_162817 [Dichomitus squalens LYAD-421 SS1]EJF58584.1 hypothetical protein DICSQDRAFT_162817 [Dichomitus squalens LYAD-421 SS1]TBU25040.1 hypothetical protein BD311DRAFT_701055 [Dichomitus squalens]TBU44321.1 hypothetical protein BD309DRAFT_920132 [Dichomitus squalens]TBU65205.1 hypothetical protein BD310DRAFT_866954 [Dichomitus squalens]
MSVFALRASDQPTQASADFTELDIFIAFQATGGIGLLAVLLTALFARKIYRHFTWLNFCITWLIYCISYLLLAFTGQQTRKEAPAYPICLTQASLIYAAPVLVAMSTFALVLQLWFTLSSALAPPAKVKSRNYVRNGLLLVAPYVAWLGAVITILVIGTLHPNTVERAGHFVYCTISSGRPGNIIAIIVAIILLVMVVFDIYIATVLYRNWRALRGSDRPGQIPLSLLVRVAIFSFVCVVGIGCAGVFLSNVAFFAGNVIIALMPLIAFLVFGTQRDILDVWMFWRH